MAQDHHHVLLRCAATACKTNFASIHQFLDAARHNQPSHIELILAHTVDIDVFGSDDEEDHVSDDAEGDGAGSDDDVPNAAIGGGKRPDASPPDPPARRYPKRGRKK